jgi:GT2 family glycosyltransferase/glycosyltransferase involved in cell wall biosynthesis
MRIFVLGMHRSGTSVVTRLINLMGAYFGPKSASTGANPENPRGFWERRDVRDENDALLWSAGADWWKVADFSLERIPNEAVDRFDNNVPRILRDLESHRPWVVKEPRFCLLLPMWRRHVETPVCVLVHRSPIQVAHSLQHRNGFPLSFGIALWERYVLDALSASAGLSRILVSYQEIMDDPTVQANRLLQQLRDAGVKDLRRLSETEIMSFVSADLFRQRQPADMETSILSTAQLELANRMASGAALGLDEIPTLSTEALRILHLYEDVCTSIDASPDGSIETDEISIAAVKAAKRRMDLDRAHTNRNDLFERVAALHLENNELRTWLDSANKEISRVRRTSQSRACRLKQVEKDLEEKTRKLREAEEARAQASAQTSDLRRAIARMEHEVADRRNKAAAAISRQRTLEGWTKTLLAFLRRAQRHFENDGAKPIWRFGPWEIRSLHRAQETRLHLADLFHEIQQWVRNHRNAIVATIEKDVHTDDSGFPLARRTSVDLSEFRNLGLDVIVCVHDSLAEVRRCLNSVISTLEGHHTLIIVDDGSDDETADFLRDFASNDEQVKLIRRDTPGGYTKAANCGLEDSTAEFVILLNSDTQVANGWWKKLARAAHQSNDIGIVGPLSNAASWQSVPEIIDEHGRLAVNRLPADLTVTDMDRIAETCSPAEFPRVELANGFCFGIKRAVLDTIGYFDEKSSPRGYGEEIDFCFRAVDAGFGVVIATDCYVYHEKSKSYSAAARDRLAKETGAILNRKYSPARIRHAVDSCKNNPSLVEIRERFGREIRDVVQRKGRVSTEGRVISRDVRTRTLSELPVKGRGGKEELLPYVLPPVNSIKPLLVPDARGFRQLREFPGKQAGRILSAMKQLDVTVIIPVHNAYEETRQCLESVFARTSFPFKLLVINDCSTDARIVDLLENVSNEPSVRVITNESNRGFVETVNVGLRHTTGDVVILNSDTIVTPRWLQKLAVAAHSEPRIATVTPFSNAAGAFSVPEIGKNRELDHWLTTDAMAHIVERLSHHDYPRVPTGNGFCMYVKREAIEDVGEFDSENFGHGYGEENDFCMRALSKGWEHRIDDSTFIYHKRAASFSSAKEALIKKNRAILDKLHPAYTPLVREFVASPQLQEIRSRIRRALDTCEDRREADATRILYVFHEGTGGTPATSADLINNLPDRYESFSLTSTSKQLLLRSHLNGVSTELHRFDLPHAWSAASFHDEAFESIYFNVLMGLSIEQVHIRHLFKHSFDLPKICRTLGISVILSFHDFYFVCPSIHLLDENGKCCEGDCPSLEDRHCRIPTPLLEDLPPMRTFVPEWREQVRKVFDCCNAFVTTSEYTRNLHKKIYPELDNRRFELIEHGRDFVQEDCVAYRRQDKHSPAKILVPGNIDFHKGTEFIKALHALDQDRRLEFHFLGTIPAEMEPLGIDHGRYQREDIQQRMLDIRPAFVGIFSPFRETYCHTLTESWASGVPVLAANLGTIKERVEKNNGGWLLDLSDPEASYKKILSIIDDPEEYDRLARGIGDIDLKSTKTMADEYDRLYRSTLLNHRQTKKKRAFRSIALFTPHPGKHGYPGSSYIRTLLPLSHPLLSESFHTRVIETAELDSTDIETKVLERETDYVLIQRDALPPDHVDAVSDVCRRKEIPLIFEIDDALLSIDQSHPEFEHYKEKQALIEKLYQHADLVTVSTPEIRDNTIRSARRIEVIGNCLDENLWFINQEGPTRDDRNSTLRVGYMGTFTHLNDLQIVADVFKEVQATLKKLHDIELEFHLIGGMRDIKGSQSWYHRVHIPPECHEYPCFVRWLRDTLDWHIAVAPLAENRLNNGKSEIKYLEYAALGVPGIYSSIGAYKKVIEHGRTGLLVEHNDKRLWKKYLLELAIDRNKREHIAGQAREHVTSVYLLKNRYRAWEQALTSLI